MCEHVVDNMHSCPQCGTEDPSQLCDSCESCEDCTEFCGLCGLCIDCCMCE